MRVAAVSAYGSVEELEIIEIPEPEPGPGQVRLRVVGSSINPFDWKLLTGSLRLLHRQSFPFVPGFDVAGVVEALGPGTTGFAPGDRVMGRLAGEHGGGWAELAVTDASVLGPAPAELDLVLAATLPLCGQTALQALRDKAGLEPGQHVLVNGASGGVGVHAVQVAKALGAEVSAVCSDRNRELVLGLGADHHIDYKTTDFRRGEVRYDVVFDAVGNTRLSACRAALTPSGVYVTTLPSPGLLLDAVTAAFGRQKARFVKVVPNTADLTWLARQVEAGTIRPVVQQVFALDEVARACALSQSGRVAGKLAVSIGGAWDDRTVREELALEGDP